MDTTAAQALINSSITPDSLNPGPVTVTHLFAHPVIPDTYGAFTVNEEGDWCPYLLLRGIVHEAQDTWFDDSEPKFLIFNTRSEDAVLIGWWAENEDCCVSPHGPTQYVPGDTVYPLLFIPSTPGGWMVSTKDLTGWEYWQ
jgi:hypothetical protein